MTHRPAERATRDRGSAPVAFVLLVTIVLAGGGLIFDGAQYLAAERQASNVAEGAARAAAAMGTPAGGLQAAAAAHAAVEHAARLGIDPDNVQVSFPSPTTVEVTVTTTRTATFGRFAGSDTITASATGRARLEFV